MSGQGQGRGRGSYGGGRGGQGQAPSQPHSLGRGNDHQHRPSTTHAPVQPQAPMQYRPAQSMPPSHGMGRGQGAQPVASSSRVPAQPQTPMQYRPAQSMPPSHGVGRGRGAQPVAASSPRVPTDAMRNLSNGTSTPVASVPVQPQPPMQQIAKTTTTQTEAVLLPLVPSSSKLIKPPARPGFGTVGRKVMITANHFLVQLGDKNPRQYDVTITPEVTSKTKCKHIMQCLIEQYKASHLGNRGLAYDGKKSAFAAGPLPFENKEFVIAVPEKDGRQREFKVAVKFAATKDIDHLRQFLSGRQHDNPQETIQALDIVLREAASSNERIIVGRSIFSTAFEMGPLGNGVDYCRGFYQSLRPTQMGLSLNLDMSARAFYRNILVSDFVSEYLGKSVTRSLSDQDRIMIKKALRNIKIEVANGGFKRTYKVLNITKEPTSQLTFTDANGTTISIVRYYREKYGTTLRLSYLPAIIAGTDAKPVYLPMEICRINDLQRYPKKLTPRQVTGMLGATCKRPQDRAREIAEVLKDNNYNQDKLVSEDFGMQVRQQPTAIEARVLPPPSLKYHGSAPQSEVTPFVGAWNMKNLVIF
ncbi:PAZ domain-containing protein [Tanacetum coccineum]